MQLLDNLLAALAPLNLLLALIGVIAGTVVGALPGLTATMAVAVLVPFTFTMAPAPALVLLGAIYTGAIYGGAYSAVLLNTPGTPSAIATTFDGFPMARRGDGDLAITLACLASVVGGLVGALFLLLLAPPLADFALAFGPIEYFWLAILGLTLVAALSEGDSIKGVVGACVGLMLSMIGSAVVGGDIRYTMDSSLLLGGVGVVPALIGLFCVPVLIDLVASRGEHLEATGKVAGFRLAEAFGIARAEKLNLARSSIIGTIVGVLPGAGGSIAALVAYSEARRASRTSPEYGKGNPGGIIASESSNNATVGGGFIPTLVLGIPGTPADAVVLGALMVQGVKTGPSLFNEQGAIVYTFIFGLLIATLLMLPVGLVLGRYAYGSIIAVPKAMLVPAVAFLTIIGSYAIHGALDDVVVMFATGLVGWVLSRFGYPPAPIVLGLILGPLAEQGFVQAWMIGSATDELPSMFFGRPISLVIIAIAALTLAWPAWTRRRDAKASAASSTDVVQAPAPASASATTSARVQVQAQAQAQASSSSRRTDTGAAIVAALLAAVAVAALWTAQDFTMFGSIFPRTIGIALFVGSLLACWRALRGRGKAAAGLPTDGLVRSVLLIATMVLWIYVLERVGLLVSSVLAFVVLALVADREPARVKRTLVFVLVGVLLVAGFHWLFQGLLGVRLPAGQWPTGG
ncbi:MAG: tripartite tricarboxylate transporter permease [Lautropia sp.]